ncbi:MAG: hypothetical protein HOH29_01735 [Cellvibrionales bacterium]|nr:hypothetical protein [Cellvibrionales bacterium]
MFFKRKNKQRKHTLPQFSFCEPSIEGLRSWVNVLPRTNIRAMSNQLIVAGKELTASNWQLSQLIAVLEILDEPIMTITNGLLRQQVNSEQEIDIYRKRQEFFNLFGHIYCVAGQAQLNSKSAQHIDELLIKASDFLCNATIASYQLYETPPEGCWQLLHKIYQYSLTSSCTEANAVKFSASYKTITAMSCASPEKLSASQIEVLAEYMRTAIVGVRISEDADNQTNFCVSFNEDQQPHRFIKKAEENEAEEDENVIYFDFHKIQITLASSCLSSNLEKHLNSSYGPPQIRAHTRTASTGALETCSDLSAIHYFLSGEKTFESFTRRFSTELTLGENKDNQNKKQKSNDVWNGIYASNWQKTEFNGNSIEFKIRNNRDNKNNKMEQFPVQRISIADLNPSGYKLVGNNIALKVYKPGYLIGLKHSDEQKWHVGIIRWSRSIKNEKQIGVELLTKKIQPFGIMIVHSKHGRDFIPALMLPAYSEESQSHNSANNFSTDTANSNQEKRADNGASLLLPQLNLTGKTAAIMVDEKSKKTIVLGDCIETSGGYCRYLYTDKNVSIGNQEARKA